MIELLDRDLELRSQTRDIELSYGRSIGLKIVMFIMSVLAVWFLTDPSFTVSNDLVMAFYRGLLVFCLLGLFFSLMRQFRRHFTAKAKLHVLEDVFDKLNAQYTVTRQQFLITQMQANVEMRLFILDMLPVKR